MDNKKKTKGYLLGIGCLFVSIFIGIFAYNFGWNLSGQILCGGSLFVAIIGIISFINPEGFGNSLMEMLAK